MIEDLCPVSHIFVNDFSLKCFEDFVEMIRVETDH